MSSIFKVPSMLPMCVPKTIILRLFILLNYILMFVILLSIDFFENVGRE